MLVNGRSPSIMVTPAGLYFNDIYKINMIVTCVWIVIAFIIFSWYLRKYLKFRKFILCTAHETFSYDTRGTLANITSFSNNKSKIKERINLIMKGKKKKNKFAFLLSFLMIACSGFTAFAYEKPHTVTWVEQPQGDIYLEDSRQMVKFSRSGEQETSTIQQIIYDSQFTDIYGNTYCIDDRYLTRKKCEHTYVNGKYSKHTKNKDGSCVTKAYDAQRCSKCGAMKLGSLESETKYTKCPH
jgi:hypothetical protein